MGLFKKKEWQDRVAEFPNRRTLTKIEENGNDILVDVARNEGVISQTGDAFAKATMDDLENRIEAGFGITLMATLAANTSTVAFTDDVITSTSIIDVYADVYGVSPKALAITGNTLTLTFDTRSTATEVMVIVRRDIDGMV